NANIDMVTNAGEPVTRYSSADFSGVGPNSSEQVSYDGAAGKRIYIDIVNRQNAALRYTLQITPELTAAAVVRADGVVDVSDTSAGSANPSDNVLPDGTYGVIPIGNVVVASIAPAGPSGFSYNTYIVEVTEALNDLSLELRSLGDDPEAADLVVQRGAVITTYDDADYNSFDTRPPRFSYDSPEQGSIYYVDVVNLSGQVVPYELRATSAGLVVSAEQARDPEAAASAEVIAPSRGSSLVSELIPGQHAYGELAGKLGVATFHTYTTSVPAGTVSLEIELNASHDLDLASQAEDAISDYLAASVYFANSLHSRERLHVDNPPAGTWYIDVVNSLGEGVNSSYTLTITVR
ncbi:MAG: pre-peptidase C-terminal domain-containing protein, partial [Deinococcota bacterium]